MPISDEEAYKQGKRIVQDMMRGGYNPSKDYSDRGYKSSKSKKRGWIILFIVVAVAITLLIVFL